MFSRATLASMAVEAARHSYSPYSGFRVGAAALWRSAGGDEAVTTGCNVENAFYAVVHGEMAAIVAGITQGHRNLVAIYVSCPDLPNDASLELAMPCGLCRQWLSEFVAPGQDCEVVIVAGDKTVREHFQLLRDLLPHPFRLMAHAGSSEFGKP